MKPEEAVENRNNARKAGERFYLGSYCRICGNNKRYVSNTSCYECGARRGRERNKRIKEEREAALLNQSASELINKHKGNILYQAWR